MFWAGKTAGVDVNELAEKLFYAHHSECEDIGDHAVLARIAGEVGMDTETVMLGLAAGDDEDEVVALIRESSERGVSGVPFFIVNGRFGVSGAQPAEQLAAVFDQVSDSQQSA